jgi:hypothetical protein
VLFRHGLRVLGEPAAAVLGVLTLIAKPRWWGVRLSTMGLLGTLAVMVVAGIALILGGIWLLDFGLPALWHHALGTYRVTAPPWIAHSSWQDLLLGFLIGRVLHRIWAPAGATLQGYRIDRSVDRAMATGKVPKWVLLPDMPPVTRERFAWDLLIRYQKAKDAKSAKATEPDEQPGTWRKVLMTALGILAVLFTIAGVIAKFWIGTHHSFPYLAP